MSASGSIVAFPQKRCLECGQPCRRLYCSDRCRLVAFRRRRRQEKERGRSSWDWLEEHPGVVGELVTFSLVGLVALGTSLGLINRRGAARGLRILLARQEAAPPSPAPPEPARRTPLYLLRPEALGRFWEA